jgi:hypothetical protein
MLRNCLGFVVVWLVLVAAYGAWLFTELPPPMHVAGPLIAATVVWFGLVMLSGARYDYRDWRASVRMARGEPPRDGDLVSATGTIGQTFEPLQSPMSGRDCVLYSYEAGTASGGAKACFGFGMTRCTVQTAYAQFHLGTFPVLEGFPRIDADPAIAGAYLESAHFEDVELSAMVRAMMSVHKEPPPLKKDFRMSRLDVETEGLSGEERIVRSGDHVTARGRFVAGTNSIVGGPREGGYLRLVPGGDAQHVPSLPSKAIRGVIVGLLMIVAANAVLLWVVSKA